MPVQKEKKIRNPSMQEIDLLENGKSKDVEAVPVISLQKEDYDEDIHKEINEFEPQPVYFRLPSGRTTVRKKYLTDKNEILVRRFTTIEESMFKNFGSQSFLLAIEAQMESCIKTNIPLQELSFIDKIPLYIFILAMTYGKDFKIPCECEMCKREFNVDIDLQKDLLDNLKYVPDDFEYPKKIKLVSYGGDMTAHYNFQNIGQNNLITEKGTILDQMLILTKRITGTDENGKTITDAQRENLVKFLNDEDRKNFRNWIMEFGEFGTDLMVSKKVCANSACEAYNKEVKILFPFASVMVDLIQRLI